MDEAKKNEETKKQPRKNHTKLILLIVGVFIVGFITSVAIRFVAYKSPNVHYHANFALYVNGQRDMFSNFTYYEEVSACSSDDKNNPKDRVHMHDQNPGLIHVHAPAVTWGQFFANLGYALGDTVLQTKNGVYVDGQDGKNLTFTLNNEPVTSVANRVIKSEDRLLINYGNQDTQTISKFYATVPSDAHQANTEHDPATCSGSVELTFWQRLKLANGL